VNLARVASCLFCNPKTSEYQKKLFTGPYFDGGRVKERKKERNIYSEQNSKIIVI
jgi:hypothetical protein